MTFLTTDKRFWDERAVTLETDSTLNGGTLDATIYQDVYGDGFPDKQTTKSLGGGVETFDLEPFVRAERADYWIKFEATGDPTLNSSKLISGKSSVIDYTSNADWRRSQSNAGFSSDGLGDHPSDDFFQRGYDYGSVTDGIIAYYPFDDDWDRDPVRDKALDNDGTNNGASYVSGQIRSAGDLNGSSDWVDLGGQETLNFGETGRMTISVWVNPDVQKQQGIVAKWDSGGEYLLRDPNGNGEIEWRTGDGTNSNTLTTTTGLIPNDTWTHIACTRNENVHAVYVNGSFQKQIAPGAFADTNRTPVIGVQEHPRNGGNFWFDGQIDEVRIYDRALSAPEIERLYNLTEPSTVTPSDTL